MSQKFPSLFRVAKNKRFNYEPWYYDPVKEELKERESRIRREMRIARGEEPEEYIPTGASGIRGSFRAGSTRKRDNSGMLRMIIVLLLVGGLLSFWYLGNDAVYFLLLLLPVYFLVKRKKLV